MICLDRTVAGEDRTFHVYTKAEADEQGIDYLDWRLARKGRWAISDDEYVFECLKVQKYPKPERNRIAFFFTFSCARKWLTRKRDTAEVVGSPELVIEEYLEKGAFYMSSPQDWIEQELRTTRAKRAISMYATLFVSRDGHLTDQEWDLIGQAYRPNETNPRATAKSLFKKEQVQDMASSKVAQLLQNNGVTRQSVVENMERLREQAMAAESFNTAYRVLEKQMEMLGMEEDLAALVPDEDQDQMEDAEYELLEEMEDELDDEEAPDAEETAVAPD